VAESLIQDGASMVYFSIRLWSIFNIIVLLSTAFSDPLVWSLIMALASSDG